MFAAMIPLLGSLLDRIIPDPAQAAAAKQAVMQLAQNGELQTLTTKAGIITAEANSANKLASSWRPILMYVFMAIIINNYIVAPYMGAMFGVSISLPMPPDMWALLKIGLGGYVVGRSAEKVVSTYAATKTASAPPAIPSSFTQGG